MENEFSGTGGLNIRSILVIWVINDGSKQVVGYKLWRKRDICRTYFEVKLASLGDN